MINICCLLATNWNGNQLATTTQGEQPKCATQVVADVLDNSSKKNLFLRHVGVLSAQPRSNLHDVVAQQEAEKMANADLRSIVTN
jgi:hypothetical protein